MSTSENTKGNSQHNPSSASATAPQENYISCNFCGKSFKDQCYLLKHVKLKHPDGEETCVMDKQIVSKSETNCNYVTCALCKKLFSERKYLVKHFKLKHQVREEGEKSLGTNGKSGNKSDTRNINTIDGESRGRIDMGNNNPNSINCSICGQSFKKITEYTHHLKVHLEPDKEIKEESSCEQQKTPSMPTPFLCGLCSESFCRKLDLISHIDTDHLKVKSSTCTLCDKSFAEKRYLNMHINVIHKFGQNFLCTFCSKLFPLESSLKKHIVVHRNLKPFSCTLCDKSFRCKTDLSRHVDVVHYGLKPFSCTLCDKSFGWKMNLAAHIKWAHLNFSKNPNTFRDCSKSSTILRNGKS